MSVEETVINIIAETLETDPDDIVPDASLIDDLGAGSLDFVAIVMSIEETFDIEIPDEDTKDLVTAKALIAYIEKHL